ncbi:retropepsin-like aspartic protease [Tunicatimonas pelagia]|uniref:retropepsin-like aspartic protease n=1 Tax=Tunicatimonas pelagia TaxID=931531 RepID=UPI002667037C|nr:retropepsin-like aspartic protease [Tunicatimonas pelagia]WKN42068.1 retropepsin-like aspartic protease [Tunicatimonas pelagia]
MKLISIGLIALLLSCRYLVETPTEVPAELAQLLEARSYFELEKALAHYEAGLPPEQYAYYQATLHNFFHRPQVSISIIGEILANSSAALPDSAVADLLKLQIDNYNKTFQYAQSANTFQQLLTNYASTLDSTERADLENTQRLWEALAEVPPQQVFKTGETMLSWQRGQVNLMNVPVKIDTTEYDFIFDTGANLSTIREGFARELGLSILETSFQLGSSIEEDITASLAVADSLYLGDILVTNVVFLVLADEQLSFPQIDYTINAILGFPVMDQLQELRIRQDGTLTIPAQPTPRNLRNMGLDGLNPIVRLALQGDTLLFKFDTGAVDTELFARYFQQHQSWITQQGRLDTVTRGGAGGTSQTEVYIVDSLTFSVGGQQAIVPEVSILVDSVGSFDEHYYGNIGQDLIGQFDEMILNFDHMYLTFE